MKKNLYYQTMFRRRNVIKEFILDLFLIFSSVPRLLLEVFIRRNFGERYFSFSTAMITIFVLAILPLITSWYAHLVGDWMYYKSGRTFDARYSEIKFLVNYSSWYVFLFAFFRMCIKRRDEIKHLPSVFDFARFSLSTGSMHPGFLNYKHHGRPLSVREIETILEPGFFFVIGLAL